MTTTFSLTVPAGRVEDAKWLCNLPPPDAASAIARLRTATTDELVQSRTAIALEQAAASAAREEHLARIESMLTSANVKAVSAGHLMTSETCKTVVRRVHAGLRLGVLNADGLWNHTYASGIEDLNCFIGVAEQEHDQDDDQRFLEGLHGAIQSKRANAGVYLSLRRHLPGKPRLAIEIAHGVPVMWATRDAFDATLSEEGLIDAALTCLSSTWPALRCAGDDASTRAAALVKRHLDECARLAPRVSFLEATAASMAREARELRATRDALVRCSTEYQTACCATPCDVVGTPSALHSPEALEAEVQLAIERYHTDHGGRYPRSAADLVGLDPFVRDHLVRTPEAFSACERTVRARKQSTKRRKEVPSS